MTWIFITILSAFFQGSASLIDKYVFSHETHSPRLAIFLWGIASFILFGLFSLIGGQISFSPLAVIGGIAAGLIYVGGYYLYYRSMPFLEVSRLVPTMTLIPVFTTIYATIFYREIFAPLVYFGIVLIILGVLVIDWQKSRTSKAKQLLIIGYLTVILSCLCFATKNVLIKYLNFSIPSSAEIMFWIGTGALIGSIFVFLTNRSEIITQFKKHKAIVHLGISTTLASLSALTLSWAISLGPVSLVVFLERIQLVYLFFAAMIFDYFRPSLLKEKLSLKIFFQKLFGNLIVLAGCYFLIF